MRRTERGKNEPVLCNSFYFNSQKKWLTYVVFFFIEFESVCVSVFSLYASHIYKNVRRISAIQMWTNCTSEHKLQEQKRIEKNCSTENCSSEHTLNKCA